MTARRIFLILILLFTWLTASTPIVHAQTAIPVVRVVLFFSHTCPHCKLVMTETLPPLLDHYGDRLQLMRVDAATPAGQTLLMATAQHFKIEYIGVPLIVIGDQFLMGSVEIPERLPGLVEAYLSEGGVGWPDIPGLQEALPNFVTPEPVSPSPPAQTSAASWTEKFNRDPLGNSLSVLVLAGMIIVAIQASGIFRHRPKLLPSQRWNGWIPILSLIGLGVAGYLSHVETAQVEAVCGPVGDCNAVQQSSYARLFGILPIGVLGLMGYTVILLLWLYGRYVSDQFTYPLILALTGFGLLFSIYLTFLEPFVIGATCAWCLTSAVIMTILFWLSLPADRPHTSRGKYSRQFKH